VSVGENIPHVDAVCPPCRSSRYFAPLAHR